MEVSSTLPETLFRLPARSSPVAAQVRLPVVPAEVVVALADRSFFTVPLVSPLVAISSPPPGVPEVLGLVVKVVVVETAGSVE